MMAENQDPMLARSTFPAGWLRGVCAVLPAAAAALCACADPQVVAYEYRPRVGFVRIERIEPGAPPNAQPASLSVETLTRGLARLQVEMGMGSAQAVFTDDELAEIVPHLSTALAKTGPGEDVAFAVAGRHGLFGAHSPTTLTTARVFVREGQLNVIFGMVHQPYQDSDVGVAPSFAPGSRSPSRGALWKLGGRGVRLAEKRTDWAMLDLGALKADAAAPVAGDGRYREIQERLRTLERLKADGLITEEEYRDRRRAILEGL